MYELGILVAFLLWALGNVLWIAERFSVRSRNLRKFGMKLSLLGEMRPMTGADLRRPFVVKAIFAIIVAGIGLVLTLTSWLYVAAYVGGFAWRLSRQSGAPAPVREFAWRLRNVDMTFDELVLQTMKMRGIDEAKFDETRRGVLEDMAERGVL